MYILFFIYILFSFLKSFGSFVVSLIRVLYTRHQKLPTSSLSSTRLGGHANACLDETKIMFKPNGFKRNVMKRFQFSFVIVPLVRVALASSRGGGAQGPPLAVHYRRAYWTQSVSWL